jgi:hypothetical protein
MVNEGISCPNWKEVEHFKSELECQSIMEASWNYFFCFSAFLLFCRGTFHKLKITKLRDKTEYPKHSEYQNTVEYRRHEGRELPFPHFHGTNLISMARFVLNHYSYGTFYDSQSPYLRSDLMQKASHPILLQPAGFVGQRLSPGGRFWSRLLQLYLGVTIGNHTDPSSTNPHEQ